MGTVHSGICDVVLAVHASYRLPWSRAARCGTRSDAAAWAGPATAPETVNGAFGYTAWASRYLHEYGVGREEPSGWSR